MVAIHRKISLKFHWVAYIGCDALSLHLSRGQILMKNRRFLSFQKMRL
jgi:hypothetical protein